MAKGQTWVSLTGEMEEILKEASETFGEDKPNQAFSRALKDWFYNRQANSKRAALGRLEESDAKILAIVSQQDARLRAIEANIGDLLRERKIVPEKKI